MQRMIRAEFRGREEGIHPHQISVREESEKDKTNHRKGEKLATAKKRAKIEDSLYEKRLKNKSKKFKT